MVTVCGFNQRVSAAFFAISDRFFAVSFSARLGPPIFPPIRPNEAAAARISGVISASGSASASLLAMTVWRNPAVLLVAPEARPAWTYVSGLHGPT